MGRELRKDGGRKERKKRKKGRREGKRKEDGMGGDPQDKILATPLPLQTKRGACLFVASA
jgi:hypothetical protein